MIIKDNKKRSIGFEQIRAATVFKKGRDTYIKGSDGSALNVETGQVTYPANDKPGEWDKCYIYPRASIEFN